MTLKEILKKELYAWFRERSNRGATVKQIQEAFPDYSPDMVEEVLNGRNSKGFYDFRVLDAYDGTYCLYTEDFLYPEEASRLATCGRDCSHCEAETCASKSEVETKAKKLSIKDRIANWFRDNGNEPAFLWEVEDAFPDVNPKSISAALSKRDSNGKFLFEHDYDYNYGRGRIMYSLYVEDYAPSASEKPLAEAETHAAEDKEEVETLSPEKMLATQFFTSSKAESSSIAKSLESIAKSLAQIAEVEKALAKRFLEK